MVTDTSASQSDDDVFVMFLAGTLVVFLSGGAIALSVWTKTIRWMLEHNIIVPAVQRPEVTFPDAGGAGLDLARILIIAAVLLALMAVAGTGIRRHLQRQDEI